MLSDDLENEFATFESNPEIEILSVQNISTDIDDPCFGILIYYKSRKLSKPGEWIK
jgi:hypothetical protein